MSEATLHWVGGQPEREREREREGEREREREMAGWRWRRRGNAVPDTNAIDEPVRRRARSELFRNPSS